jgi:hypothetical protein
MEIPSEIEKIHASKVANLPLRNEKGAYDRHTPPDLSTSAQISDYIQTRTAAWTQHLSRRRQRGGGTLPGGPSGKPTGRPSARPARRPAKRRGK